MELIDIVDENGIPIGETIDRTDAHRTGSRHRTTHIWIVRRRNNRVQILLQKRAKYKDSFPGCYDISSAGHIPAGVDFIASGLRELQEETGLTERDVENLQFRYITLRLKNGEVRQNYYFFLLHMPCATTTLLHLFF